MGTARCAALSAVLALAGSTLPAQSEGPSEERILAAESMSDGAAVAVRVDSLIAERTGAGDLVLATSQPDRLVPGRNIQHFSQVVEGVPILGAGVTRQQAGGVTISAFGTLYDDLDIDVHPSLNAEAALARIEEVAGVGPATTDPPALVVFPTSLGRLVLAWSATMRDFRTWFIDAHSGELVHRHDHMRTQAAVGSGLGITGARQKLSVWRSGQRYEAWDRLRPAEIVTLDAQGDFDMLDALLEPSPAWEDAVASDDDNEWSDPAVVDGQAHLGYTYDYLLRSQAWRGMDGRDGRIFSVVNIDFPNAFFIPGPFGPQGTGAVGFGQSDDGTAWVSLDTVGHEVGHGVIDAALETRTGLPLIGRNEFILGPSQIRVEVGAGLQGPIFEVFRCGDLYSFELYDPPSGDQGPPPGDMKAPLLCFDENGDPTRSRSGRFGLFMDHGGAIHEAYADILGTAVEFAFHPPGDGLLRADYVQGEDIEFPVRRIDSPRSMSIGPFPFPDAFGSSFRFVVAHLGGREIRYTGLGMKDGRPFRLPSDGYSGVHWNSTILSHAYYLAIEGGTHASSGRTVASVGVDNRLQIEQAFFRALIDLAPPFADFQTMGAAIRQAAVDLNGAGSAAHMAVDQALTAVGL